MKKLLLITLITSGSIISAYAQTLTLSDFTPSFGDSFVIANADYVDPGDGGQNQTWDFGDMMNTGEYTNTYVNPAGQPGASNFPNANFASVIPGEDQVAYVSIANNKLEIMGIYSPQVLMTYPDPKSQLEFPISYQSAFEDTYERYVDLGGGIANQEVGVMTAVADGSGTLITPIGTFTDVLRVRLETTADLNTIMNGDIISTTAFTDVSHVFLKEGYPTALLSLVNSEFAGSSTMLATYYVDGTVGVAEMSPVSDFVIYPVPAVNEVTLNFDLKNSEAVQFNLNSIDGRLLGQLGDEILPQGRNSIKLDLPTDIASGIYLLQLKTEQGSETRKIVIQ